MISNFLFHRVNPRRDPLWDPMDVRLFDRCIKHISTHYQVVLLEEFVNDPQPQSGRPLATVMFDDGFKDNMEYAAETLAAHKCRASFYVVTDCIEQNIPTWTYLLDHAFLSTQKKSLDLSFAFLPEGMRHANLSTHQGRMKLAAKLKQFLKRLSEVQRSVVLKRVSETYDDVETPRVMMSWNDLAELKSAGHYIGSHSKTHGVLGTMTSPTEISNELSGSAAAIRKNLGHQPSTISFPVGSYNDTTIELSRQAGYTIGLAVKQRRYDPVEDSIFEIPRIELYNEPWWKTRLRIGNLPADIKRVIGWP